MKIYGAEVAEGSEITNLTVKTGTSDPTNPNAGELFFRTDLKKLRIHNGTEWQDIGLANVEIYEFTATANQTTFSGTDIHNKTLSYTATSVSVFLNGVRLDAADYTATNGTSVVLGQGAASGDTLSVLSFGPISVADIYSKTEADAAFAPITRSRKNLIINGNFDIWQRSGSQTSSGYGSDDRWNNQHNGSSKTHSLQTRDLTNIGSLPGRSWAFSRTVVSSVTGAANYVLKVQSIEGVWWTAGKTLTLSFWAKADAARNIAVEFMQGFGTGGSPSALVNGIGVQKIALTTSWAKYTHTVNIPSISGKTIGTEGDSYLALVFWFDAGSNYNSRTGSLGQQSGTFDLAGVQLEVGEDATDFEDRSTGEELALCQRYYLSLPGTVYASPYGKNTNVMVSFHFPVTMRAIPSAVNATLTNIPSPTWYKNTTSAQVIDNGTATTGITAATDFTASAEL